MLKTFTRSAAVLMIGLFFAAPALAAFNDVPMGDAYEEAINYVQANGIVSGYLDHTFRPTDTINRAEFTKIIVGATSGYDPSKDPSGYDIYSSTGVPYTDMEAGAWYIPWLREARARSIVTGYSDGTFRPGDFVNFAEASKILIVGFDEKLDAGTDGPWYAGYIKKLAALNAIPANIKRFDQKLTRGEMAEIVFRLKTKLTTKSSKGYGDLN